MKKLIVGLFLALVLLSLSDPAYACSVCFGDPNSPMTHGARAAVLFMVGVVGFVLSSIVAVTIYWVRRARLLQVQATLRPVENGEDAGFGVAESI